jgi:O-antigen biosynthesis protein
MGAATKKPLVSVLMSTFNGSRFLVDSIKSIQGQSLLDLEMIIIDDGSFDDTPAILGEMSSLDSRIKVFRRTREGLTSALNLAFTNSQGDYLARQDDDDISAPERLETQVRWMENHPEHGLIGCGHSIVNEDGKVLESCDHERNSDFLANAILKRNYFCHGTVMLRRSMMETLGGYREKFHFAQDYDLVLRAAETSKLHILQGTSYFWKSRMESISIAQKPEQLVFSLLAKIFAAERAKYGEDSYDNLHLSGHSDLEGVARFVSSWRMQRIFTVLVCKAFAGRENSAATLNRLGINPILASLLNIPKRGMKALRSTWPSTRTN